jgi:di/tricarboxylate transporter
LSAQAVKAFDVVRRLIKHGCAWLQVFGSQLGVEPVTAAMLAVGCLLATGVLSWADCLAYTAAWDTLIWFTGRQGAGSRWSHSCLAC